MIAVMVTGMTAKSMDRSRWRRIMRRLAAIPTAINTTWKINQCTRYHLR
jgi:hypothetical protein